MPNYGLVEGAGRGLIRLGENLNDRTAVAGERDYQMALEEKKAKARAMREENLARVRHEYGMKRIERKQEGRMEAIEAQTEGRLDVEKLRQQGKDKRAGQKHAPKGYDLIMKEDEYGNKTIPVLYNRDTGEIVSGDAPEEAPVTWEEAVAAAKREAADRDPMGPNLLRGEEAVKAAYDGLTPEEWITRRAQEIMQQGQGGGVEGGRLMAEEELPAPTSKAEYDQLPPGTRYRHPDGSTRVKGGGQ